MEELREKIAELVAFWRPVLALSEWLIRVEFGEEKNLAVCEVRREYEEATLRFNLTRIAAEVENEAQMHELVLHELAHCIVDGIARSRKKDELAATRLSRCVLRAWNKARGGDAAWEEAEDDGKNYCA
jgi:hypothetical protein